jgi:hypothetical protein
MEIAPHLGAGRLVRQRALPVCALPGGVIYFAVPFALGATLMICAEIRRPLSRA